MQAAALQAIKRFRSKELNPKPRAFKFPQPPQVSSASSSPRQIPPTSSSNAIPQNSRKLLNPFVPHLNPLTKRWAPPKYSLRQQADLIKKARLSGTLKLLPPGLKLSAIEIAEARQPKVIKYEEVVWEGKVQEKKTGIDAVNRLYRGKKRMFKGHKWERERPARLARQKMLMRSMRKRVLWYKGYYARRRPNPLKPSRSAKSGKLPF